MTALITLAFHRLTLADAERLSEDLEALDTAPRAVSLDEADEAQGLWSVTAYFEDEAVARAAADQMAGHLTKLPERDWVRLSLEGLAPVRAGRFQLYGAHDHDKRQSGGIVLEIDAGTAFGTGHHGTTAGCLIAFDRILKSRRPRRVLDLGCGSGVLALAAAKALRARVLASDIDAEAVRVAKANSRNNALGPLLCAVTAAGLEAPALRQGASHDLIFANILARPLVALAGGLAKRLAPGGLLLLSGLTAGQERLVAPAYRNRGLVQQFRVRREGWSVIVFAKSKRPAASLRPGV